jgi:hypothetical protein
VFIGNIVAVRGAAVKAGKRLYGLAQELGKPVARGLLPLEQAFAACIVATVEAERAGETEGYRSADIVSLQRHLVVIHAERETQRRDLAAHKICRLLAPMIALRRPWGALMAEAHGVNGASGFPLTEAEVSELVETEVWFALPRAPRGARHG